MGEGSGRRFLLLYGSQTGQAKAIAERVRDLARERGLYPDIHCISQSEKEFDITKEPVVVVIVSTTGDGEPPDTVSKFWRKLKRKTVAKTHLSGVCYGLLGLGDTNYNNFCNMGKNLHRRMQELGATAFVDPGWADDGTGLEIVVEPWIKALWEPLERTLQQTHSPRSTESTPQNDSTASKTSTHSTSVNIEPHRADSTSGVSRPDQNTADLGNRECTSTDSTAIKTPLLAVMGIGSAFELERELKDGGSEAPNDVPLSLPTVPPSYLSVKCEEPLPSRAAEFPYKEIEFIYGQAGCVIMATIVRCRQLTNEGALRKTLELELLVEGDTLSYAPGDALSFICPNPSDEVDLLLNRLGLMSCADHMMQLEISIAPGTSSRNFILPRHVPTPCSTRQYFTHCADFRAVPKKVLLRYLSSCCSDKTEKRRLEELCSRSHATEYNRVILGRHADLLDILFAFPSCQPSLDRLIQFLPKLKPRFYSLASSPLTSPRRLIITLSITHLPQRLWWNGKAAAADMRMGLASGFFYSAMQKLAQNCTIQVPLVPRGVNKFRLPEDPTLPVIMIGPGTGIAPFIGFLEHRRNQHRNGTAVVGKAWLFFGCRHPDLDHIYQCELDQFLACGTLTTLTVCFSRLEGQRCSEGEGRYVQDGMRNHSMKLAQWVMEDKACVYVCGDAKAMAKDVEATWKSILSDYVSKKKQLEGEEEGVWGGGGGGEGKEGVDGVKILEELKEGSRYLVDAWTT